MRDIGCKLGGMECHYAALAGNIPTWHYLRKLECAGNDLVPAYAAAHHKLEMTDRPSITDIPDRNPRVIMPRRTAHWVRYNGYMPTTVCGKPRPLIMRVATKCMIGSWPMVAPLTRRTLEIKCYDRKWNMTPKGYTDNLLYW